MLRKAFLMLLLILAAAPVMADELLHDDWHAYHDFFTIDEDYYEVTNVQMYATDKILLKTLLKRNHESVIITATAYFDDEEDTYYVREEVCKEEGARRYCLINISIEPEEGARSDEGGTYRYGTRFKIYEIVPETAMVEIDRSIKSTELDYGKETKVTVDLTNKGNKTAKDIVYNETIGTGLTITRQEGFTYQVGSRLSAVIPQLASGEGKGLTYWIKAVEYVNKTTLEGNLTYTDPYDPVTTLDQDSLTIPWPYDTKLQLKDSEAKIDQPTTLTYTLTNNEQATAKANITLRLSPNLKGTAKQGLSQITTNLFTAQQELEASEAQAYIVDLRSLYTGDYNVTIHLSLDLYDQHFEREESTTLSVHNDQITPNIVVSKPKLRAGDPITVGAYLHNEDKDVPYFTIKGTMQTDFFSETYTVDKLSPDERVNPLFKRYELPRVPQQTTFTIILYGTFITQSGEQGNFSTQENIIVLPENQSIILLQDVDKSTVKRGDELTVTISVENVADSGYKVVTVADEYDEELEKTFGSDHADHHLFGGEQRQLYLYRLRVPFSYTKNTFTITSTLIAQGEPVNAISKTITVTDPLPANTYQPQEETGEAAEERVVEETVETEEETTQPDKEPDEQTIAEDVDLVEEKKGFIGRVIAGIGDFFANFFG